MNTRGNRNGQPARGKAPKIRIENSTKNLTTNTGLIPVIHFLQKLGFEHIFNQELDYTRAPNAEYTLFDSVYLTLIGVIGGARSVRQCVILWSDNVLRTVARWNFLPDQTTVFRIFKGVNERNISELETCIHRLREEVWRRARKAGNSQLAVGNSEWIDVDSTVKTVYGQQEGSEKGYNPHKKGALSYHPLLAFFSGNQGSFARMVTFGKCVYQQWNCGVYETIIGAIAGY